MKYKAIAWIGLVLVMMGSYRSLAQSETTMYRLQSLFIYNFTKHIKWDASENGPFTIGIYASTSQTSYKSIKQSLENKMVWGDKINVITIKSASEAANCHIVYIPKLSDKKASEFINQMNPSNILLVTEDDLIDKGAAISLY
jgi:hypothetical protein